MSKTAAKTADFLKAMQPAEEPVAAAQPVRVERAPTPAPVSAETPEPKPARSKATSTRAGLKHFGGYLDDDTLEKIALLRVRLKKDNSELIKFAIDELHRKHNAKRAFGDA